MNTVKAMLDLALMMMRQARLLRDEGQLVEARVVAARARSWRDGYWALERARRQG